MFLANAPLFGEKHIIGLLVIAVLVTALLWNQKHESYQRNRKRIFVLMILFYLLEFAKLLYLIIQSGSFPMNHLPFHLCSLPLYLYPILYFSKEDSKLQKTVKPAAFAVIMLSAIIALAMPTTIIGSELSWLPLGNNILPLISFTYHGLMIYAALVMIKSGYYQPVRSDVLLSYLVTLPLLAFALTANYFLDKDYMSLNYGSGVPFAFLRETSQLLYMATLIAVAYLIIYIVFIITRILRQSKTNNVTNKKWSNQ